MLSGYSLLFDFGFTDYESGDFTNLFNVLLYFLNTGDYLG